jgi:hypothetical protein
MKSNCSSSYGFGHDPIGPLAVGERELVVQVRPRMVAQWTIMKPKGTKAHALHHRFFGKVLRLFINRTELFDGDGFGEVAGLVNVEAFGPGEGVGENLQRDNVYGGGEQFSVRR